jgi:hypothetical protein
VSLENIITLSDKISTAELYVSRELDGFSIFGGG